MLNKLVAILFVLFPFAIEAQEKQLRGIVITDELKVENVTVTNTTTNISTVTGSNGSFTIEAKVKDVLTFQGDIFKPLIIVLKPSDFAEEALVVRLEPAATMLNEVVVTGLTGNLAVDSKKIKTPQINTWFNAAEINKDVLTNSNIGANWIAGVSMLFKKPKKPKRATEYTQSVKSQRRFSEIVKDSYPEEFFTETLKLRVSLIGAFLAFCDDRADRKLLQENYGMELIEFLKTQSAEFLKLNPDAK
ncbi:hypothetical protein AAEO56_04805 [Flavobacterium sp. DGU11]|uniref:CarboxypepD_reg-like domain-containing protein n=1 Tax=Flavobacterium arundinis TaxID=3139143 RepID=A0ABU9HTT8_9FLAO